MYNPFDTIAAIATPPGEGALAIVRLSGASAKIIASNVFTGAAMEDRKAVYGHIMASGGEVVDEVIAVYYRKPHGYTAEDMVEVICHGGYVIPQQILSLFCRSGARLAEPGEFTLRAFLNGRIDLTEAEAVNAIIRAKTEKARQLAMNNLEGKLHQRLERTQAKLLDLVTIIEAQIDFADDEIDKMPKTEIDSRMQAIKRELESLLSTYDIGRLAEGRVQIAIVGAPNVGKSTLFNALLSEDRAIVTEIPGTTRDYLSEYVNIGGFPVILTDTAGLRSSENKIESIGMEKTRRLIAESDLCLFMLDASRPIGSEDRVIANDLANHQYILVVNKIDIVSDSFSNEYHGADIQSVSISARNKTGLDKLDALLKERLLKNDSEHADGVLLSQRQYECAKRAYIFMDGSQEALARDEHDEIIVGLLRECLDALGEMVGKTTSEDILNRIFGQFCIGK
jgi:tRNA modification GTPase